MVAVAYSRLLIENPDKQFIATSCPAVVSYVEKYHPEIVEHLAPVVSPMIAMARIIRELDDSDPAVVFVGPCIAKKCESTDDNLPDEVDAVLTFAELRELLSQRRLIDDKNIVASDFDPPHPNLGALLSLSGGLLQAARISEDLLTGEVVETHGRTNFVGAIKEFGSGVLDCKLLELLCCDGCIMGAGMTTTKPLFARRAEVSRYAQRRTRFNDMETWRNNIARFSGINFTRAYTSRDQRLPSPSPEKLAEILKRMGKFKPESELNCGACGYDSCREHAIAIHKGLAENEMCLPYTIELLKTNLQRLAETNQELQAVQKALIQSEKLASMGQLAAGIAHEINNPLGVVLLYSHMLLDEHSDNREIADDLKIIVEHADRSKGIIGGLLNFARQNKVNPETIDLNELIAKSLKAVQVPFNVKIRINGLKNDPFVELDPDQIIQVLTNLYTNAIAAMANGGELTISLSGNEKSFTIAVADTGCGIPQDKIAKIYEPFYTTKEIGKGTGLGLAVSYGIIKMHRGSIHTESNDDPSAGPTGSTFTITLPRYTE